MAWIGAAAGLAGGLLGGGSSGSSKEAKKWRKAVMPSVKGKLIPTLNNLQEQQYFPGQTYANTNPYEQGAIGGLGDYASQLFPQMYGGLAGAQAGGLSGQGPLDQYAQGLGGMFMPALQQQIGAGAPQLGAYGGTDPSAALGSLLSGDIDTRGVGDAMTAAFDPAEKSFGRMLENFRDAGNAATSGQGGSGVIKSGERALTDFGDAMARESAGMGAGMYRDAQNRMAQGSGLALQQQGLGLQGSMANLGAQQDFTGQLLGGAGLGAGTTSDAAMNQARWGSMTPATLQAGLLGPQALATAGTAQRGLDQLPISEDVARHQFGQQAPYDYASFYGNNLMNIIGSSGYNPQQVQGGGGSLGAGLLLGASLWPQGGFGGGQKQTPTYNPWNPPV